MKRIARHYLIETTTLYYASFIAGGMVFEKGFLSVLTAGAFLTLANFLAKPIINLMLLPLNLVTFGVFRWVSSAIALFLVTLVYHNFKIIFFDFAGFSSKWIDVPHFHFTGALAFIGFSLIISLITSFIYWLIK